jgi:hypothetical protein
MSYTSGLGLSLDKACAEIDRLCAINAELLSSCKELTDACAACFRVIARETGLPQKLDEEFQRIGLVEGFGTRAKAAILKADTQGI